MGDDRQTREAIAMIVQEALREGPFSLRELADEMGGSYGTLREWSRGARNPSDENIQRIAAAYETRARRLLALAERMRKAAGGVPAADP
jgi:transcriptional regulator with XRE-family HTH domain